MSSSIIRWHLFYTWLPQYCSWLRSRIIVSTTITGIWLHRWDFINENVQQKIIIFHPYRFSVWFSQFFTCLVLFMHVARIEEFKVAINNKSVDGWKVALGSSHPNVLYNINNKSSMCLLLNYNGYHIRMHTSIFYSLLDVNLISSPYV